MSYTTETMENTMIHTDLSVSQLVDAALLRQEGQLASNQALVVNTGKRTGRSPNDRFIVRDEITEHTVDWNQINKPFNANQFNALWDKVSQYLRARERYELHAQVGSDPHLHLPVTVITEKAWHSLFAKQLLIRTRSKTAGITGEWTILDVPSYQAEPSVDGTNSEAAIIFHFAARRILICGTQYAGEIKKALFSALNFLLPDHNVLPMHCAANVARNGESALFFGLSGTGKTTLSADPKRLLVGDDEHGWSSSGIFNFEGGCYAKCIDLSQEREPLIWNALKYGAVMENVVLDKHGNPDFHDSSLTQNTRAAYPLEFIEERVKENAAQHPHAVLFLTCDLYGVLPPVALLTKEQAAYYFLSGYTALVGSTEVGSTAGIKPTFSTCFGAPFFPRPAQVYADLLIKRLTETHAQVYLVNTGWTGGAYGAGGERFSIPTTRAIVNAILDQSIDATTCTTLPILNLQIPTKLTGIDSKLLDPRQGWTDKAAYTEQTKLLATKFQENFTKFKVDEKIKNAGPVI